jgi:hypothetical protein
MNNDIVKSVATSVVMSVLGTVGAWLVNNGIVTSDDWSKAVPGIAMLIVAIALAAWKALQHTDAAKVDNMKDVTGTTVVVDMKTAAPAVQQLANDPAVKHVEPAPSAQPAQ